MTKSKLLGRNTFFIALALTACMPLPAKAAEFCEEWAQYLWNFQQGGESAADSTWAELGQMKAKLQKGRRLATVGSVSKNEAFPFPSLPSEVEGNLDAPTQAKLRGLYDKYVLLDRKIEDIWKDRFRKEASGGSMQRFAAERDSIIQEMNKISRVAKTELIRYGVRVKDCFEDYEGVARHEVRTLQSSLASAQSNLKVSQELWTNTESKAAAEVPRTVPLATSMDAPGAVPVVPQVPTNISGRAPASAKAGSFSATESEGSGN